MPSLRKSPSAAYKGALHLAGSPCAKRGRTTTNIVAKVNCAYCINFMNSQRLDNNMEYKNLRAQLDAIVAKQYNPNVTAAAPSAPHLASTVLGQQIELQDYQQEMIASIVEPPKPKLLEAPPRIKQLKKGFAGERKSRRSPNNEI